MDTAARPSLAELRAAFVAEARAQARLALRAKFPVFECFTCKVSLLFGALYVKCPDYVLLYNIM